MESLLKIWRPLCYVQWIALMGLYLFLGLTPAPERMMPGYNDLLMHFTGYILAGVSISFAWPRWTYQTRAGFLLLYSIAIEIAQHFSPPRTFSLMDILANFAGILVGLLLFMLLKRYSPNWAKPFLR